MAQFSMEIMRLTGSVLHGNQQLLFFIQAHHLDLDFYDQGFKEGSYLQTHRDHFANWHGGMEIPRRPK